MDLRPGPAARAPRANVAFFDNPGTAADGLRTSDQFDMYNGSPERYDWKLVGKKEMLVPYNAYKLHWAKTKPDDVIKPLHINQDLARYELHRVGGDVEMSPWDALRGELLEEDAAVDRSGGAAAGVAHVGPVGF